MDASLINPFISAISGVLPQLGFKNVSRKGVGLGVRQLNIDGIALSLDIMGEKTGNIVYAISEESAKKIASKMMMGIPINDFDDIAKSAVSELSNMLTANSTINLSNNGVNVDISVPKMYYGNNISIDMRKEQVIKVDFDVDDFNLMTYISIG